MGASSSIMQELREDSSIQGRRVSHQPRRWDEWCVVSDVPLRRWGRGRGPWGRGQRGITEPVGGCQCGEMERTDTKAGTERHCSAAWRLDGTPSRCTCTVQAGLFPNWAAGFHEPKKHHVWGRDRFPSSCSYVGGHAPQLPAVE